MRLKDAASWTVFGRFVDKGTFAKRYDGIVVSITDCHLLVSINGKPVLTHDLPNVQLKRSYS